jgi:hypothetical protein
MPDYFPGLIDEVRISGRALPVEHLRLHEANEGNPLRFYGVGSTDAATDLAMSPVAVPMFVTADAGTALTIDPVARASGGAATLQSITAPSLGTASISTGRISFLSSTAGVTTMTATLAGSSGKTSVAQIQITVNGVAPPPPPPPPPPGGDFGFQATISLPAWGTGLPSLATFLLPFAVVNSNLRTVANGGRVQNSNGFDIRFVNAAGAKLAHRLIYYDGAAGIVVATVNFARNFAAAETIRIQVGKAGLTVSEENVTGAAAGGWLAIYCGDRFDRTGAGRDLTNFNNPRATAIDLWPAQNVNGSTSYLGTGTTSVGSWLNGLSALSVVSYHRSVSTERKHEVFNIANAAAAELSIHLNDATTQRLTFVAKFGTTTHQYQTANNTQSIDGQAMAAVAQAGQAIRVALNGVLDVAGSSATVGTGTSTSVTRPLEWGRGNRGDLINWDGDLAFLGFCSAALPTPAIESMTAAFFNPSRVYTLGTFAAVP